jgi:hypothetical protein
MSAVSVLGQPGSMERRDYSVRRQALGRAPARVHRRTSRLTRAKWRSCNRVSGVVRTEAITSRSLLCGGLPSQAGAKGSRLARRGEVQAAMQDASSKPDRSRD